MYSVYIDLPMLIVAFQVVSDVAPGLASPASPFLPINEDGILRVGKKDGITWFVCKVCVHVFKAL